MKKIIVIFVLIVLAGCKAKKNSETQLDENKAEKLTLSTVDLNLKNKAYELGKRMLMTCNTSKFKPYDQTEATTSVISNITEERLSKTCAKYRQWYGTFKDLELVEVLQSSSDQTTIFRYKALYTKKVANKELRVFMNDENKLSSIKTLDWIDTFDNK